MKTFYDSSLSALKKYVEERHGGKVNAASRALGLKDPCVLHQWLSGKRSPSLTVLGPAFDIMGVRLNEPDSEIVDYDLVPKVAAKAGAGSSLETSGETLGMYAFRKSFLAREGIHAKASIMIEVTGDSMEPFIKHGDTILVDTSDRDVRDGLTYLVAYGDDLKVKHIFKSPQGLIMRSENPRYADVTITPDELGSYAVIHGRVRWFGRLL